MKSSRYRESIGCRLSEIFIVKVLFYAPTCVHYKCETLDVQTTLRPRSKWHVIRPLIVTAPFHIESLIIWKTRSWFYVSILSGCKQRKLRVAFFNSFVYESQKSNRKSKICDQHNSTPPFFITHPKLISNNIRNVSSCISRDETSLSFLSSN